MVCKLLRARSIQLSCFSFCHHVEVIGQLVIIGVFDESLAGKVAKATERVLTVMEGTSACR